MKHNLAPKLAESGNNMAARPKRYTLHLFRNTDDNKDGPERRLSAKEAQCCDRATD